MVINILFIIACAVLWRLGGAGFKGCRRYGVPFLILVYATVFGNVFGGFLSGAVIFGTSYLPITLKGSEIRPNYWWLPLLGLLHGSSILAFSMFTNWFAAPIFAVLFTAYCVTANELKNTVKFDTWEIQELATGATLALFLTFLR